MTFFLTMSADLPGSAHSCLPPRGPRGQQVEIGGSDVLTAWGGQGFEPACLASLFSTGSRRSHNKKRSGWSSTLRVCTSHNNTQCTSEPLVEYEAGGRWAFRWPVWFSSVSVTHNCLGSCQKSALQHHLHARSACCLLPVTKHIYLVKWPQT